VNIPYTTSFTPKYMTTLILVRHGETEWNREGRIQGHSDSALTTEGVAQAHAMGARLRENLANEPINVVLASDLPRAARTATMIAEPIGQQIVFDVRLRERAFGVAEGKTYEEIDRDHPEMFSRVRETDPDFSAPGGESRNQFHARVTTTLRDIAAAHAGKRILVVTHGGAIAAVYRWLNGLPVSSPHKIEIPNVAYNRINAGVSPWSIEVWGDINHHPELMRREEQA
jgi:2,3-bisphosphoglycerate-dependent phosphoglycerate mutase